MQRRQSVRDGNSDATVNAEDGDSELVNYQCPDCIYSCLTNSDFVDHMKETHGKTALCCVTADCILWYLSQNGL